MRVPYMYALKGCILGFFLLEGRVFLGALAEPTPKELCLQNSFGVVIILSCYFSEHGSAI